MIPLTVLRLFDSSERNSAEQVAYYDPGVGTLPQPGLANPVKWLKWKLWNFADLAIGWGLEQNVEEAYRFLMQVWEPGDNVFLFGFSRGAYTARVLAGLLNTVGLLRRNTDNLVPYLLSMYKSVGEGDQGNYWELTNAVSESILPSNRRGTTFPHSFSGRVGYGVLIWLPIQSHFSTHGVQS
jgi:uncharacterized protein (DUF2235 family)